MIVVNYTTLRNNLKDYCNKATDENEIVIITRKNEKNVALINLEKYNEMVKIIENIKNNSKE